MLIIAHRGYHAAVPENTLAAFEAAVTVGVNGIETDVRISRDGLPVLIHDRVTGSGDAVADLTRAEIEQFSVTRYRPWMKRWKASRTSCGMLRSNPHLRYLQ